MSNKKRGRVRFTVHLKKLSNLPLPIGEPVFISWKRGSKKDSGTTRVVSVNASSEAIFEERLEMTAKFYLDGDKLPDKLEEKKLKIRVKENKKKGFIKRHKSIGKLIIRLNEFRPDDQPHDAIKQILMSNSKLEQARLSFSVKASLVTVDGRSGIPKIDEDFTATTEETNTESQDSEDAIDEEEDLTKEGARDLNIRPQQSIAFAEFTETGGGATVQVMAKPNSEIAASEKNSFSEASNTLPVGLMTVAPNITGVLAGDPGQQTGLSRRHLVPSSNSSAAIPSIINDPRVVKKQVEQIPTAPPAIIKTVNIGPSASTTTNSSSPIADLKKVKSGGAVNFKVLLVVAIVLLLVMLASMFR